MAPCSAREEGVATFNEGGDSLKCYNACIWENQAGKTRHPFPPLDTTTSYHSSMITQMNNNNNNDDDDDDDDDDNNPYTSILAF